MDVDEQEITRILQLDLSAGTDAFRDALLARCLEVITEQTGTEIDDDELDMLAAAGNPDELFANMEDNLV